MPVEIYFSYAREEENLVKQFKNQLASLQRLGLINDWYRSKVVPGQAVKRSIGEWGSRKGTAFAEIANEISAVVKNLKSSA